MVKTESQRQIHKGYTETEEIEQTAFDKERSIYWETERQKQRDKWIERQPERQKGETERQ